MGCCNPVRCAMMQTVVLVGIAAGASALHFYGATEQRAMIDRFLTPPRPAMADGATPQEADRDGQAAPDDQGATTTTPATGDGQTDTAPPQQAADPNKSFSLDDLGEMITVDQAYKIYRLPDEDPNVLVIFLDARGRERYDALHIRDAYNVTPESFFDGTLPDDLAFWPKDSIIVVYCDGGECDASHLVEARLKQQKAFERVYLIEAGFPGWQSAGLPTEASN